MKTGQGKNQKIGICYPCKPHSANPVKVRQTRSNSGKNPDSPTPRSHPKIHSSTKSPKFAPRNFTQEPRRPLPICVNPRNLRTSARWPAVKDSDLRPPPLSSETSAKERPVSPIVFQPLTKTSAPIRPPPPRGADAPPTVHPSKNPIIRQTNLHTPSSTKLKDCGHQITPVISARNPMKSRDPGFLC
jgi:hypothetical protein